MKNIKINNSSRIVSLLALFLAFACNKEDGKLSLSRQFSPTKFTITNGETQSTVTWSASLFTTSGKVTYAVEISDKVDDFSNPAYTTTTTDVSVVLTDNMLTIKKDYYARVKAQGQDKTADSNWLVSSSFRILGEQFLNTVTSDNVIDQSVRLYWRASSDLTSIVITPVGGGTPIVITLSAADLTATMKQIDNLTPGTAYTAEIFAGTKTKGTQPFTTKPGITGTNVFDLRSTTGDPTILVTTLNTAPSGSIIILKRGESYNISTPYLLSKSVSVVGGLDFGTNLPVIKMTSNFNFTTGAAIDSIVFKDLIIKGSRANRASYDNDYIINANVAATINKVRLENCTVKILRGILRGQAAAPGAQYKNYIINNCQIDSIREFAIATASAGSAFGNITITNTTIYRTRKFIVHSVAGNLSINIANCTFNELVAGTAAPAANYFIDFGTSQNSTNGITIKNTIFGKVWDETSAGTAVAGIRTGTSTAVTVTNTYNTSDFVNTTSPISGLATYSGAATALFTDPNNGNFLIKDSNFIGKGSSGDPRWR